MNKKVIYELVKEQMFETMRMMTTICGEGDLNKAFITMNELGLWKVYNGVGYLRNLVEELENANE